METLPDFTLLMTWLILGANSVAVALLVWSAFALPFHRRRALFGCLAMVGILVAMGVMLWISTRSSHADERVSQWLLPLWPSVMIVGLYRLTFPGREKL